MSLQFVLGRAGSGKSTYCLEEAVRAEEQGKRVLMLVPEQYSHQGESAFLERKGYIHDGFQVTSFGRLARKTLLSCGASSVSLDSAGKAMLVLKAIRKVRKNLLFYRNFSEKAGHISLFMDMISELKKGQVSPDALKEVAEQVDDRLFSMRLTDLASIYEAYNELLTGSQCDTDDELSLMAELTQKNALFAGTCVFIDAFSRFTQNELSVIRAFLVCGASVTVTLCMPEGKHSELSVFHGVFRTYQSLFRLAQDTNTSVLPPVILTGNPRYISEELGLLEQALAGEKVSPLQDTPKDISIYVAKGKYEEVTYVASTIRKLVAENDIAYRDIAVVTGDYDGYADLINSQFPLYHIPVFADTRQDFLSHPVVLYLFSLFDLLESISTQHMVAYMKSGFADISPNDAAQLENFALAAGIEYGDWLNDNRFLYKIRGVFESADNRENDVDFLSMKNRLLAPVLALKERLSASLRIDERVDALFTFLEEEHLSEKMEQKAKAFREKGLLRRAEEFTDVYNILIQTLDAFTSALGEQTAGLSTMRAVLEAGLSQRSIGVIPTVYDQVAYGDLNRSVIKNPRILFILGANDGVFPPLPQAGALLSDREREYLNDRGIYVAPDSKRLVTDAEFSVYTATSACGEKLFVSYSISDSEGHGMRPATLVSRVKRLFPGIAPVFEADSKELPIETAVSSKPSAYQYLLTHLTEENDITTKLFDTLYTDADYQEKLDRAKVYASYENTAGKLSPETVSALYGDTLQGSVSRFERFAACPFSFFIEYGLKAKERKILKVEAPDIGSLLHEIIEQFSRRLLAEGKSFRTVTEEEQKSICDSITDEMFSAMYAKDIFSAGRLESLKNRMKSLITKSVWALCAQVAKGDFEPTGFEVGFGENEELPPVTVSLPDGGKVVLSGRIDRIDTLTHHGDLYLKIIDYKSGSKRYSLADIFNGNTLQLAVYSIAATDGMKGKTDASDVKFGGMLYFHLDDAIQEGIPSPETEPITDLKTYKLSGLVSDKTEIIHAMDSGIVGQSSIIPVYFTKNGTPSESLSKLADDAKIEKLRHHILTTVEKIGAEIMNGTVDIYPIRSTQTNPCSYCKYINVCGFDANVHPCRRLKTFSSDADIWAEMD
ncbi:MAG: exodeoxyribonuclease V subunit gamma [Clostridia bacterium]|nr:exodeoxyribonuclease V subunit gamma [Clostridia bacterium]